MKTNLKKLLAMCLVVVMVFALMPTLAFAAAGDVTSAAGTYTSANNRGATGNTEATAAISVSVDGVPLESYNITVTTFKTWGVVGTNAFELAINSAYKASLKIDDMSGGFSGEWETKVNDRFKGTLWVWPKNDTNITVSLTHNFSGAEHIFVEQSRVAATCEVDGTIYYACSIPGCTETKTEPITKLGHNMTGGPAIVAATCEVDGTSTLSCVNSGCTKTEVTPLTKTGHDYAAWTYDAGSDAAGDGAGSTHSSTCANDSSHVQSNVACSFTQTAFTDATATVDGSRTFTCDDCGHDYTVVIPATGVFWDLTYDDNGGTGGPGIVVGISQQSGYVLDSTAPTHQDDNGTAVLFLGWTAAKDTTIYKRGDTAPTCITTVDLMTNTTVYAVYGLDANGDNEPDVNQTFYNLTYGANGGQAATVPVDTTDYLAGDKVTLSASTPMHDDAANGDKIVFIGWTAAQDTKIYASGDVAPTCITEVDFVDADITVYAVYGLDTNDDGKPDVNESTYSVSYDVGTGKGGPASVSGLLAQEDYELDSTTKPTHDDADGKAVVFMGWMAAAPTAIYSAADTPPALAAAVDIAGDTTVYAAYGYDDNKNGIADINETFVTLTYLANSGTGAPASETKALDQSSGLAVFTVSSTVPTRDGYTFTGWNTMADGKGTAYAAGKSISIDASTSLYAQWEQIPLKKYTIKYDANGGKNAPDSQAVETRLGYGDITITKSMPTRDGYTFWGWATTKDAKNEEFKPGDNVRVSAEEVTLYAVYGKTLSSNTPKTGDESNIALWATLLGVSAIGMAAALYFGKKRKEN